MTVSTKRRNVSKSKTNKLSKFKSRSNTRKHVNKSRKMRGGSSKGQPPHKLSRSDSISSTSSKGYGFGGNSLPRRGSISSTSSKGYGFGENSLPRRGSTSSKGYGFGENYPIRYSNFGFNNEIIVPQRPHRLNSLPIIQGFEFGFGDNARNIHNAVKLDKTGMGFPYMANQVELDTKTGMGFPYMESHTKSLPRSRRDSSEFGFGFGDNKY